MNHQEAKMLKPKKRMGRVRIFNPRYGYVAGRVKNPECPIVDPDFDTMVYAEWRKW